MTALTKWKAAAYLAAIFLAGSVSGWVAGTTWARQAAQHRPHPREVVSTFRERTRSLNLTPEQVSQIDAIATRSAAEFNAINEESMQRARACFSNRHAQVCSLFNPTQREQFEAIERERKNRWIGKPPDHWRPPPPPPQGPPR